MITIVCPSRYKVNKAAISRAATAFFMAHDIDESTIDCTVAFVGKKKMRDVSLTYKHEDVALPVLAFPYMEKTESGRLFWGEVVMCYPQVILLAAERNRRVDTMIDQLLEHALNNLLKEAQ
jgi:ssRNA-specific RNase YbeY (16S rRNA maturation enzyme)